MTARPFHGEVPRQKVEVLARAIHQEDYVRNDRQKDETPATNPSMVPWDELSTEERESKRQRAEDIGSQLRAIGCDIEMPTDREPDRFAFTAEEIELLSRMEHDRWWKDREAAGWTYAPEKDVRRRKSPYLVPWEELPEAIREYDRVVVRGIPAFLARAGFRVVRGEEARLGRSGG